MALCGPKEDAARAAALANAVTSALGAAALGCRRSVRRAGDCGAVREAPGNRDELPRREESALRHELTLLGTAARRSLPLPAEDEHVHAEAAFAVSPKRDAARPPANWADNEVRPFLETIEELIR